MFCSRRKANMAGDVDFISMSRSGHTLPKLEHLTSCLALTYYFHHVACHVIIVSKFNKSANWWRIISLLISKWAFSMQIEIIYLATSGMIFLDFVFRRYKWSKVEFCWKKTAFCPIKIFCEKRDDHSKRERKKIIALHLKRVFAGTATNFK